MSSLTSWENHPVKQKIENLKVLATRDMEFADYMTFFTGFLTVGSVDVMKNFGHVWPCVGDVANIAEAGYDTYKYMDRYKKTDNSFMIINAFSRGMSGVQTALDWKCMSNDVNDLILRDTSSHEFSMMPHAPGSTHFQKALPKAVVEHIKDKAKVVAKEGIKNLAGESGNMNKIASGDSMQRNAYDALQTGG